MSFPSFPEYIQQKGASFGKRVFLKDFGEERAYTYEEFARLSARMAKGLATMGIGEGDRVAILHPNHTDFVLAYSSIAHAGGVAVPINPLYTRGEVLFILQDSGAKALITTRSFKKLVEDIKGEAPSLELVVMKEEGELLIQTLERLLGTLRGELVRELSPESPALIFYTSGTTGRPKGVILNQRNLVFGGANTAQNYGLREDDVALVCLPLVHIFANASPVLGSLNAGGKAVIMERFQSDIALEAMERERITWFPGVPTMFAYLIEAYQRAPRKIPCLRMGLSGGASMSAEHLSRFQEMFQVPVIEVYGLTESTGLVTANPVHGVRKVGSIGIQVSGVSTRLLDETGKEVALGEVGELVFKGPNATPGYWNLPDLTLSTIRDGWVYTKDLARMDEEGYYFIVGRKDELIICGGYNVYPREIEEVLYQHESVGEAAVIGVSHPTLGQVPKAFLAPKKGRRIEEEVIREHCAKYLAPYKVPRYFQVMDELPKSSTGKILKKMLS